MPLNISGSIITSNSSDILDQKSIVTRDLVYHLDADSPNCYPITGRPKATDISGAMINSGTMYTGNAISFDGTNDSIAVGALSDPPRDSGSVLCWVNVADTSSPVVGKFIDSQGGWFGIQRVGSSINVYAGYTGSGPYAINLGSIGANSWYHVCGTHNAYGSGDIRVYINGKQVGSTYSAGGTTQGNNFTIGPNGTGASKICDMRVYNIGLTNEQVNEIYRNPGTPIPAGAVPTNLAGWWPMTEGSGTKAFDCSGYNNHGTLTNGPSHITGQASIPQLAGKGHSTKLYMNGGNDYVDTGDNWSPGAGDFTFSAWVFMYPSITGTYGSIISKGRVIPGDPVNGAGLIHHGSDIIVLDFSTTVSTSWSRHTLSADATAHYDKWTHVAVSVDRDGLIIGCVDGVITTSTGNAGSYPNRHHLNSGVIEDTELYIGSMRATADNGDNSNFRFDGLIDEAVVWDKAFNEDELRALGERTNYFQPNPPDARGIASENLAGYWRNEGHTWKDLSVNGNNGTISGGNALVSFSRGIDENRDVHGMHSPVGRFRLNGSDSYIKPADNALFDIREQITVTAWVKATGSGHRRIVNKEEDNSTYDRPWSFNWTSSNKLQVGFNDYNLNVENDTTLLNNIWYQVGFTYDKDAGSDDGVKFYVNGVIDGTANYSTILDSTSKVPGIGAGYIYNASVGDPFEGDMANVQIYNKELSSTEIQHNFNVQRDRFGV